MKKTLLTRDFTKQIEGVLVPFLIEQGFSQQGIDHYRRYSSPFVHCISLQERSDRKAMCVNMGVHLDFLGVPGRLVTLPVKDVIEMECCIRTRLTPRGEYDYWWPCTFAKWRVKSIRKAFEKHGVSFFERYTSFPGILESITVEDIRCGNASKIWREKSWLGMAVLLAQVHEHIESKDKAILFSEFGLELLKEANARHTRAMKKELEDIIRRCKA